MAIIGTYKDLAEAQKLVQSKLLEGVIEEIYEVGQLVPRMPVFTMDSLSLDYRREVNLPDADYYDIGEPIPWSGAQEYDSVSVSLKRVLKQQVLDKFIEKTYRNPNDYRAQVIKELNKGCIRTVEDGVIYGNSTTNAKQFDGLHKLCPTAQTINEGSTATPSALNLSNLRKLVSYIKPGKPDALICSTGLKLNVLDKAKQEGISAGDTNTRVANSSSMWGGVDIGGQHFDTFDGIPIWPTDYITDTETIASSTFSAKTGGASTTIFAVKFGQIHEGGVCLGLGGDTGGEQFFMVYEFDKLENYDAAGIRYVAYCTLALGSTKALAKLDGIAASTAMAL